jgi:hypothetical protein
MTLFSNEEWHAEISTMGFQSLIYDQNGRLIASVEPRELGQTLSNAQVSRLIAASPAMYDLLVGAAFQMEDSMPMTAQVIRDFLARIDSDPAFELRTGARH